jgi:DNA-binding NtrC family response regulator
MQILIVDDDKNQCKTLSLILRHKGYDVATAGGGEEAVIYASNTKDIDLVFLDIKMPDMNGVDTYRRLKAIIPNAIVVMMTGYAVEDLIKEALQEGVYSVMQKPIDIEHLISMVDNAMVKKNGAFILVVDDDLSALSSFKDVLVRKGYRVETAQDGEEAIALSSSRDFDIVFLDLRLPTLNGLETYLEIKQNKPDVIAIMITGYYQDMSNLVEESLHQSAYACLEKPLDMGAVLSMVEEVIEKKNRRRQK